MNRGLRAIGRGTDRPGIDRHPKAGFRHPRLREIGMLDGEELRVGEPAVQLPLPRGQAGLDEQPAAHLRHALRRAMRAFSQLLDDLVYTRSRNTKLKLIGDYLKETPDPDRGYALAALTGTLDIPHVKPAAVRALVAERIDPVLFAMSRDYVGDTSETVSLLWPTPPGEPPEVDDATISISDAIERLRSAGKMEAPRVLSRMLDHLDASGRFALLKLALGELRVGINARLAKQALADAFGLEVEAVEEVWHGLKPPFTELFDWAEGRSEQPIVRDVPVFRPFMNYRTLISPVEPL